MYTSSHLPFFFWPQSIAPASTTSRAVLFSRLWPMKSRPFFQGEFYAFFPSCPGLTRLTRRIFPLLEPSFPFDSFLAPCEDVVFLLSFNLSCLSSSLPRYRQSALSAIPRLPAWSTLFVEALLSSPPLVPGIMDSPPPALPPAGFPLSHHREPPFPPKFLFLFFFTKRIPVRHSCVV